MKSTTEVVLYPLQDFGIVRFGDKNSTYYFSLSGKQRNS